MASMDDLLGSLDDQAEEKQDQQDKAEQLDAVKSSGDKVAAAVNTNTQSTADGLNNIKGEVKVTNPTDVSGVVDSINKLNLTTFMQNEGLPQLAKNLGDLSGKTQDLQDKLENEGLKKMSDQLGQVVKKLDEVSKTLSKTEVSVDAKLQKTIDNLSKSIGAIDFKPSVNVSTPQTKVVTTPVDLKPLLAALGSVEQAIKDSEAPETEVDLSSVTSGLAEVRNAITALRFPVPNYVLPFRGIDGKATQVQLDASGNIPTSGGGGGAGGAVTIADGANVTQGANADAAVTAGSAGTVSGKLRQISSDISAGKTNQTNGTQQTKLTDGTNIANTLKSDGTAAGQNAAIVSGTGMTTATLTLNSGSPNTAWFDMLNYAWWSVEILTNTTPATLTFQTSGDASETNVSSTSAFISNATNSTGTVTSTTSASATYHGPRTGRYFRISSNNGAGTTTLVLTFFTNASAMNTYGGITVGANSATGSAVPANAFYIGAKSGANLTGLLMGAQTTANSLGVALATDQVAIPVTESGTWTFGSSTATGSAVPANAFYNGVNPQTALPTAATVGNLTGATGDKFGRTVVIPGTLRDLVGTQTTTITASTAETTIVTAAASTFNDLTALVVSNTSATAARLDFRDTAAGSILFSLYVPAGDVRGVAFQRPGPQTTVNTNWTTQSSASVTDLRVYAVFDKNA